MFKKFAARLPSRWQTELKRIHFARQINQGAFGTDEPEYVILDRYVKSANWVIDIGANVGHYTKRFSDLVGPQGRVIAFEPVPKTFSLLAANVELFEHSNVSLINAAVSDHLDVVGMEIPNFSTGLANYYRAHLTPGASNSLSVLTLSLNSLRIDQRLDLVKIDAEGHEAFVMAGIKELIEVHQPVLIVETDSEEVVADIVSLGYRQERLLDSPNVLFTPSQ